MSIRLQHLREAASFLSTFIGRVGEIAVDLTNNRLIMQDGVTAGGWPAAKLSEVVTNTRTTVADANYTALATDRLIAYMALTAARTVILPAAAAYPTGTRLVVVDESGSCSATGTITLVRASSDTINGAASAAIASAFGFLSLESDGTSKWTITDQAASNLPQVGIGTPADPANPLSVFGTSALFNSAGNFNFTINKAASTNTASTIYEDGFSGRAQVGLCGDDNFHFKVSPNGSTWYDALDINASTGNVGVGTSNPQAPLEVTANAAVVAPPSSTLLHIVGANGTTCRLTLDGFLNGSISNNPNIVYRAAEGTAASPSAMLSGDILGQFSWFGYGTTGYCASARVQIRGITTQGWTDSAQGTALAFFTSLNGTVNTTEAMRVDNTGNIGIGTTTPAQKLDVAGNIAISGTTAVGSDRSIYLGSFTVSTLPAPGTQGRMAFVTNGRMFNGAGTLEGAGAGTGGLVIDNGTAWKIAGTNQTVQA